MGEKYFEKQATSLKEYVERAADTPHRQTGGYKISPKARFEVAHAYWAQQACCQTSFHTWLEYTQNNVAATSKKAQEI